MKVPEHNHPLELIDLQQKYSPYEEEENDDHDDSVLIIEHSFWGSTCDRCNQDITMYHRYYYKCISSCNYSLHKFCAEISTRLVHASHPHPLTLFDSRRRQLGRRCSNCNIVLRYVDINYECSLCDFFLDIKCVVEVGKKIIYHPCHSHLLMAAIRKPISCECSACGNTHWGVFYQCTTCDTFTIHKGCAFLPKKLVIQLTTNDAFSHTHPLTISYSFPREDQIAKHHPKCRVCGGGFYDTEYLWIYKCDKCMYYAHVDCATSGKKQSLGSLALLAGFENPTLLDYYPHLLQLPFPDETYSIPKHLLFKEFRSETFGVEEVNLKHIGHQHPLLLVKTQCNYSIEQSSSMCHNPMKKIQLLCNGCLKPITTMPFFKCANEDERCNFALHEWCTRLPAEIENHPGHSQHTLVLMSNVLEMFCGVFLCAVCHLPCNGFAYCCVKCKYYVDVTCGLIPTEITHKAHPNHLLSVVQIKDLYKPCQMCLLPLNWDPISMLVLEEQLVVVCTECDIYIHPECALLLPETIRHKYDKHPMHLSYLPIENHKSEYFCEICEEDLNPHAAFYHCHDCVQSIHTACAPLILQSETETYSCYPRSAYCFVNIKFGGVHNTHGHSHPLSFDQGIVSDGLCSMCGEGLQYKMIFKCLYCKFAIDYGCCRESLYKL